MKVCIAFCCEAYSSHCIHCIVVFALPLIIARIMYTITSLTAVTLGGAYEKGGVT